MAIGVNKQMQENIIVMMILLKEDKISEELKRKKSMTLHKALDFRDVAVED